MHGNGSDEIAFFDVSTYFSDDEWKLLHEWQQDLYRNVMKEIHQALISLGPLIATTVFSLRAKEQAALSRIGNHESKTRHGIDYSLSDGTAQPEVLYRVNREEHQYLMNPLDAQGREVNECFNTGYTFLDNDISSRKEEPPSIFIDHLGADVQETNTDVNLGHGIISTRIKEEEETFCIDSKNSRIDCNSGPTGNPVFTSVFLQSVKPKKQTHFQKELKPEEKSVGGGRKSRKRRTGFFVEYTEKTAVSDVNEKIKEEAEVFQSSEIRTKSNSHLWSEHNLELGEGTSASQEISFTSPEHFSSNPRNFKLKQTYKDDELAGSLWNTKLLKVHPNTQPHLRPYACTECEKSFKMKHHLTRHKRTHTGERPFNCTECGKNFSLKHHLLGHQKTHNVMNERKSSFRGNTVFHSREPTWE